MPTRWETKLVVLDDFFHKRTQLKDVETYLDELGARGWEIAGVTTPTNSTTVTVFLKRPRT